VLAVLSPTILDLRPAAPFFPMISTLRPYQGVLIGPRVEIIGEEWRTRCEKRVGAG